MSRRALTRILSVAATAALVALPLAPAHADTAEPTLSSSAWYWSEQQSQPVTDPTTGVDAFTLEAPDPFCPTTPAGGLPQEADKCKQGRLPVQVANGNYEEPDMMSAVAFDLAIVPFDSDVKSFKATFIEADDEQSQPFNAEGKKLQACLVEQFFGDGAAREYEEAPRFKCSKSDPVAKRKPTTIKNEEGEKEERFAWTFDLTGFAQGWIDGEQPVAAIMIRPVEPKEVDPTTDLNWRVVLQGGVDPEGLQTKISFTPPPVADLDDAFDTDTDTGSDFADTGSDFDSGSSTDTSVDTAPPATEEADAGDEPVEVDGDQVVATGDIDPAAGALPAYVWLALLVGLVALSLFRQVVLESGAGPRPDGVLAQIRKINADRRGVSLDETSAVAGGALGAVAAQLRGVRAAASGLVSKIKRKG